MKQNVKKLSLCCVVVLIIAGLGAFAIISSKAAIGTITNEPEVAAIKQPAIAISDTSASLQKAVQFKASTTTTPTTPSTVKPSTANTGVPAGTTFTNSGSITATTSGQTIKNLSITGGILLKANNITIENCRIKMEGYFGIRIEDGVTGTTIKNCEVYTTNGGYTGIAGANALIKNNYVHGFENAITVGGNSIVENNLIEKLRGDSAGPHFDGIEVYSGSNIRIAYNNIRMTDVNGAWLNDTGAINITPTWTDISNITVANNWLGGGSYTMNLDEQNGYKLRTLTVTNNRWYGSGPRGYAAYGPIALSNLITTKSGNVWDDTGTVI